MIEFIKTQGYHRQVFHQHINGKGAEGSCNQINSVDCDRCRATRKSVAARAIAEDQFQVHREGEEEGVKGAQVVEHQLREV